MHYTKKILILTDSLAFPRSEPEYVSYGETYISLLKESYPHIDFIHYGHGGSTIVNLYEYSKYFHDTIEPDLVFIQCGVVDCAPRALTFTEQQIVKRLPLINKFLVYLVKRFSKELRSIRKISYTSKDVFAEYIDIFEKTFKNVVWINIMPPPDYYQEQIPNILASINDFNSLFNSRNHIATSAFNESDIMRDGHHMSLAGHKKLALLMVEHIHGLEGEREH